ncbi:calcium/sodium antiporter [Litorimonas sp.]|uniref:calcium/sodium antiporter n=1 Tax=Litorimonas sp. TaxID=1892381 RepID=UPI003A871CB1
MFLSIVFVLIGLGLLMGGGEFLVRGSVAIADRMGLSKALIGATFVGFGTSMPEFVASFGAAAAGEDAIALGNVVGSDTVNLLLILGACALIYPMAAPRGRLGLDFFFVMLASLICLLIIYLGGLPVWMAAILLAVFIVYMVQLFRSDKGGFESEVSVVAHSMPIALILSVFGIGLLVAGAELLIKGASGIATFYNVPEAIIGITIVGVGTSAPELFASIMASFKKENAIAFGNIIGSNIFNVFAVLGITGLFFPLTDLGGFSIWDGVILVVATIAMFAFAATRHRISRWEGGLMVAAYIAYLVWLVMQAMG